MQALGVLKQAGAIDSGRVRVRFRAAIHDKLLLALARQFGIEELIESPVDSLSRDLVEMLRADGLLILQASNCNEQIPAKLY